MKSTACQLRRPLRSRAAVSRGIDSAGPQSGAHISSHSSPSIKAAYEAVPAENLNGRMRATRVQDSVRINRDCGRAEIGLDTRFPLDARPLAAHLNIPVNHVMAEDPSVLSAMTLFPHWPLPHRVIIFNDDNSLARQNSDLAHELSHGLLMHEPTAAIINGCRLYEKADEDEAAWLTGCLLIPLIPRDAALLIAASDMSAAIAASEYGVSTRMITWSVNSTGCETPGGCESHATVQQRLDNLPMAFIPPPRTHVSRADRGVVEASSSAGAGGVGGSSRRRLVVRAFGEGSRFRTFEMYASGG